MGDLFDPVNIGVIQRLFYWVARRDAPLDPGIVRGGQPVIKQGRDNMRTMRCSKSGLPFYKILEEARARRTKINTGLGRVTGSGRTVVTHKQIPLPLPAFVQIIYTATRIGSKSRFSNTTSPCFH